MDGIEPVRPMMPEGVRRMKIIGLHVTALAHRRQLTEAEFRPLYGDAGSRAFWDIELHGAQPIPRFLHALTVLGSVPEEGYAPLERMDVLKQALRKAIFEAMISDAPIFSGKLSELQSVEYPRDLENLKLVRLKCRETAEWLFRNPLWTHLVTNTLRRYLETVGGDEARRRETQITDAGNATPPVVKSTKQHIRHSHVDLVNTLKADRVLREREGRRPAPTHEEAVAILNARGLRPTRQDARNAVKEVYPNLKPGRRVSVRGGLN
jgi:hypothetical protein